MKKIKWINAGKKLPEYDKIVLMVCYNVKAASVSDIYIMIGRRKFTDKYGDSFTGIDGDEYRIDHSEHGASRIVTHWADLPEIPDMYKENK